MIFSRILFPVDFSLRCAAAAPQVRTLAERFGAEVTLLNVLPMPPAWYGGPDAVALAALMPARRDERLQQLERIAETEFRGIPVKTVQREGDPARVIVEYARVEGMSLIAMATHGCGLFRRTLLGSVTAKVLHDSSCPVWTTAHSEASQPGQDAPPSHVLAAVGQDRRSIPLMVWAQRVAEACASPLTLVHAIPGGAAFPQEYLDAELQLSLEQQAREQIAELQKAAGIDAPLCVGAGDLSEVICQTAEEHGFDLLLIGRGHLQQRLGGLRTHAYAIIRKSPCPVLSI